MTIFIALALVIVFEAAALAYIAWGTNE